MLPVELEFTESIPPFVYYGTVYCSSCSWTVELITTTYLGKEEKDFVCTNPFCKQMWRCIPIEKVKELSQTEVARLLSECDSIET